MYPEGANIRPEPDQVLVDIADYVMQYQVTSEEAYRTAHLSLMDALGCGLAALAQADRLSVLLCGAAGFGFVTLAGAIKGYRDSRK